MLKILLLLFLLLWSSFIFPQQSLMVQGEILEILSSERPELTGILSKPKLSPYPSQAFSLERQSESNRYLLIYDLSAKRLTEIRTVLPKSGVQLVEDSIRLAVVYNGQLDWRPTLDDQDQQWFAFVSNGTQNNRDIYLGFIGGSNYIRLTIDPAADNQPKWSPDGNSIAFVSNRSGDGDIYLIGEVDKIIADLNRNEKNFKMYQLTDTPLKETDLAWNPNPKARLLAYAKQERFSGREVETFQIRILDLGQKENNVLEVTNDPLAHYTRPSWDPHTGSKLLFVGQSFTQNLAASLYLSELARGEDKRLKNKVMQGYKTEIFKNLYLSGTALLWLAGGDAILCQEDRPEQNYPLYSVNINKWLDKKERAVSYFEDLHRVFPYIYEFDVRKNDFLFITQEGEYFKIYLTQVFGDDILPEKIPEFSFATKTTVVSSSAAEGSGGISSSTTKYIVAGGAVAAGVIAYFLLRDTSEDAAIESVPIGLPPGMPGGN
jgi:dipeptidyl aminopeptidase/acylaminoacyl peptidase